MIIIIGPDLNLNTSKRRYLAISRQRHFCYFAILHWLLVAKYDKDSTLVSAAKVKVSFFCFLSRPKAMIGICTTCSKISPLKTKAY